MVRKKTLLRRLLPWIIFIAALAALVIFVGIPLYSQEEETVEYPPTISYYEGDGKPLTMENDSLLFEMDTNTTQFKVTDKVTGQAWYSNPIDADSDPIALSANKATLKSTLILTYTTNGGTVDNNNYTYSIENQSYDIVSQEDGSIRVNYSIGQIEKTYIFPVAMNREGYEELTGQMSKSTKKKLASNYTLYTVDKLDSRADKDELIAMYPSIAEQDLYVLKSETSSNNKAKIEGYYAEIGYTLEDYEQDMQLVAGAKENTGPVFNVSMVYRLEDHDLVVEIPYSDIRYRSAYPITYISPLPMFGAAGTQDEGYMIVPEGGGAVIHYNNGKLSQSVYYANLYGWDYGTERKEVVNETENAFPAFAMTRPGASFLCILEGPTSYAGVNADIAGRTNSFNTVYAKYNVLHYDQYNVSAKTAQLVYMYEAELPQDTVVQRYRFLDTDDYAQVASVYGEYLRASDEKLAGSQASEEMPVSVELLGAIDKVEVKFGLPVDSTVAITTFDEAEEILGSLKEAGVKNMSARFSGWANGGVKQRVLTSVHVLGELGGNNSMEKLISWASQENIPLYFDGISCFAYRSGITNGFTAYSNAARFTTREQIKLYNYDIITYKQMDNEKPYYLVKPAYASACAENLLKTLQERNAYGVAFRDIGDLLSADYNPKDTVTREQVKAMNVAILQKAVENGQKVMIRKGNDYAIAYADLITDMNLSGNAYAILDGNIPFYQIALHGMKDYTGDPINLAADYQEELLNAAEYGAGLNFTFMNASGTLLQETDYSGFYAADYTAWREKAAEIIIRYQTEMAGLNCTPITGHERLTENVAVTTYGNGTKVYVNYGDEDYRVGGLTIPARDYLVKGGAAQ